MLAGGRKTLQRVFLFLWFSSCRNSLGSLGNEKWGGKGRKSWRWLPIALMLFCRLTTGRQCETPSKESWQPGEPRTERRWWCSHAVLPACLTLASWNTSLQQSNFAIKVVGSLEVLYIPPKLRNRINILLAAYFPPPLHL